MVNQLFFNFFQDKNNHKSPGTFFFLQYAYNNHIQLQNLGMKVISIYYDIKLKSILISIPVSRY